MSSSFRLTSRPGHTLVLAGSDQTVTVAFSVSAAADVGRRVADALPSTGSSNLLSPAC